MRLSDDQCVYLKLSAVSAIWGGTFVAGRVLAGELSPLLSASLRFLLAGTVLLVSLLFRRVQLPRPGFIQWCQLALLGLVGVFAYNVCFFYGLRYIDASRAALIVALNPAAIALLAAVFQGERPSASRVAGILLCVSGAAVVILGVDGVPSSTGSWLGDGLILGCVLAWAIFSVASRGLARDIGPLPTVSYAVILGAVMLSVAGWLSGEAGTAALSAISTAQWACLAYLGVVGSALAYVWYYEGIARIGAARSGAFIALNPVTAVLLGMLLLGERPTWSLVIGGALAVSGIVLSNTPRPDAEQRR
ncbi:DMT family transporter [Jeongeupia chitinilytica]|uniref:Membrane protein n=1 Tax=Jeongeupia chitinilytica TaxID=1041641 RepID=A0ABQ3H0J5_9NEIS|nr:DMT family transporter [Jeongeupia chitinilytica]GHD59018.1 membrane protein [Jeongeupia chitinilytica]